MKISKEELEDIFLQGDTRYDISHLNTLTDFFNSNALILEKHALPDIDIDKAKLEQIPGPQKLQKAIVSKILKDNNFEIIGYERDIGPGRVDVLAKKENKLVAVECGPCRLTKAINYFRLKDIHELWIVLIYLDENTLYIIRRGEQWENYLKKYDNKIRAELKNIISPLDQLDS